MSARSSRSLVPLALALAFSAAQFVASPYIGVWSDRIGRRPAIILCATAFGILTAANVDRTAGQVGLMNTTATWMVSP